MNYRIVENESFKVFGVYIESVYNLLYHETPEFCDKIWEDGTHHKINKFKDIQKRIYKINDICKVN